MCSRHYSGLWTLLALIVAVAVAAPPQAPAAESQQTPQQPDLTADDVVLYDQRQNGTENVRISLSDLKVVLAPADGLFQIMSMAGAQFLNSELTSPSKLQHRPTSDTECTGFKCNNRHRQTAKTNRFKLSNIVAPLLQNNNLAAEQKHATGAAESNSIKN